MWWDRSAAGGAGVAALLLLVLLAAFPLFAGNYPVKLLQEILVGGVFAMSLDLILGYTGLPSFGHAAFFGLGAYGTALLSAKLGVANLGITLPVTIAVSAIAALLIGWLAIRTAGVYFLMLFSWERVAFPDDFSVARIAAEQLRARFGRAPVAGQVS